MSDLKMYEITLEVESVDGNQVFGCYAHSEEEARLKLKNGECDIIEESIEVLSLNDKPIDVFESKCIKSRLTSDMLSEKGVEIAQLKADKAELLELLECMVIVYGKDDSYDGGLLPDDAQEDTVAMSMRLLQKHKG